MTRSLSLCAFLASAVCSAQQITFQAFSSGAQAIDASNTQLSATFGQPMLINGTSTSFKLESGFRPALIALNTNFPPSISFSPPQSISASDKLQAQVTDIDGIAKAMLYYRPIAGVEFDSVQMDPVSSNYEKAVQAPWIDAMGMEYYLTATDVTGLKSTLPATHNTYFHSFTLADGAFIPSTAYNIGRKTTEYRIISVPYDFGNASIGFQLDELANEEGQHTNANYRLATYAGNDNWNEFPSAAVSEFKRGVGYWFLTTKQDQITFSGPSTPQEHQQKLYSMTLQPGWNQVGNPYTVPISWENVRNYNANANVQQIKVYNAGYSDGDEIQPYGGGFVNLGGSNAVTIEIPFKGQVSGGGRTRVEFANDLSAEAWMLRLALKGNHTINNVAAIGMHPLAHEGLDAYDDFNPPAFREMTELEFINTSSSALSLAKDIVVRKPSHRWSFVPHGNSDQPLQLQWNADVLETGGYQLFLFDPDHFQLIDMTRVAEYTVRTGVTYQIYYGEHAIGEIESERSGLGNPYPNPLPAGSHLNVPFILEGRDMNFQVELIVLDLKGRPVINRHDQLRSGVHVFSWDGLDSDEAAIAPGIYIVRLQLSRLGKTLAFHRRILITR